MDAGPAKLRRRFTAGTRDVSFPMLLTLAQLQDLDDHYLTTTASGALPFVMTNPRTGLVENWRFKAPPKYTAATGNLFSVEATFEIMP